MAQAEVGRVDASVEPPLAMLQTLDVSKSLTRHTLLIIELVGSGRDDLVVVATAAEHSLSNPVAPNGMVPPKKV